jgi:mannose-6-phosphate isomerase class I
MLGKEVAMPLYENRNNALNTVTLAGDLLADVHVGNESVIRSMVDNLLKKQVDRPRIIAIDGWYGVDFEQLVDSLRLCAKQERKLTVETIAMASVFRSEEEIGTYVHTYLTDDPSFGWVNRDGVLSDLLDTAKVATLRNRLQNRDSVADLVVVYGPGACVPELTEVYDYIVYADFTMQPMLWKMWGGELVPFGKTKPDTSYVWKQYYYNDFYLLYRQKKHLFSVMDYYVDAVVADELKGMGACAYQSMIDELVQYPIKQVKIMQPGPWGAYRYKDLWQVEGLECNAWNELAGIELSILVDIGAGKPINIPSQNIMQRPKQLVGAHVAQTYPDLFPLQVWLDDGYFPEPVAWERSSMPIHNHPSTQYVQEHFNEPLGRYETYYIVESYRNSSTWMGYKEDADLEEWERLCRESENRKVIPNWEDFIKRWDTNVGDLFLIPPGTTHGHGGNQMILEMDTGPSVAGTEYSFFTYDFARNTWDDTTKTMSAKPMKMHLEHSFNNQKWIRESRVLSHHRSRPLTIDGNGKFRKDRYATIPEMPFHIERIFMEETADNDTEGRFMHIVTLTEGERITIMSKSDPTRKTTIERLQSCVIPAGFGEHSFINESGRHAMVVVLRLKKG